MEVDEKGNALRIVCPHIGCGAELSDTDLAREASEEMFQRISNIRLNYYLEQDPNFFWCAHDDCGNGQIVEDIGRNRFMRCLACGRMTCTHHRSIWHDGRTCEEYDAEQEGVSPKTQ